MSVFAAMIAAKHLYSKSLEFHNFNQVSRYPVTIVVIITDASGTLKCPCWAS